MRVLDTGLSLYRKTVKRIYPAHAAIHRVITHTVIPFLEWSTGFRTIADDPLWFRLELLTRRHERHTLRHLADLVRPGMAALDVGGHVGYYARELAERVGPDGRVITLEPHPRSFDMLCRNTERYPQVTPLQIAAAEAHGEAQLYDYLIMSASGSLHYDESLRDRQKASTRTGDIAPRLERDLPVETFTVETAPLDDLLQAQGIDTVDVVKMDIEGAELSALRGLQHTIDRSPNLALIMEYNPNALKAFHVEPYNAVDEVLAYGFTQVEAIQEDGTLLDLSADRMALIHLTARLSAEMGVINLLFRKQS